MDPYFLRPDPAISREHGLDQAILAELEKEFAEAFDSGVLDRDEMRISLGTVYEVLHGGPIMAYMEGLKADAVEAIKVLPKLDPNNAAAVIQVQSAIARYIHLIEWVKGGISRGTNGASQDVEALED